MPYPNAHIASACQCLVANTGVAFLIAVSLVNQCQGDLQPEKKVDPLLQQKAEQRPARSRCKHLRGQHAVTVPASIAAAQLFKVPLSLEPSAACSSRPVAGHAQPCDSAFVLTCRSWSPGHSREAAWPLQGDMSLESKLAELREAAYGKVLQCLPYPRELVRRVRMCLLLLRSTSLLGCHASCHEVLPGTPCCLGPSACLEAAEAFAATCRSMRYCCPS